MLPRPMIEDFWDRVSNIANKSCRLSDQKMRSAVERFRAEIEPNVGEMIYHENADKVAETLVNAVKHGEYQDIERKGA
ncbi:MAG TPA: hypothetical protein VE988_00965 [Gemmataceae bacterium]|nr:hypothetical protein [Gemmataceae bacterium]